MDVPRNIRLFWEIIGTVQEAKVLRYMKSPKPLLDSTNMLFGAYWKISPPSHWQDPQWSSFTRNYYSSSA
jgi:hypothetical protein